MDPIDTSNEIVGDYLRYLRTLLPLGDPHLHRALDVAIASGSSLHRGPFIEGAPAYARGCSLIELIEEGVLPQGFTRLHSSALPMERSLYAHQENAIRKAAAGRSLVVSTGTGSGKTESFLIPVLSHLISESEQSPLAPGVRAIFLYPMNALANDQMKRLRQVLAVTPDITFGRYIGDTPRDKRDAFARFDQLNPGEPRLLNELLSREEMQETPPHLLLTNYAMLEYLLLRPADMDLFEGQFGGRWKFVVVDEAHVYDGARGSELAMLLRRLRSRVGSEDLQCIGTSATVGADSDPASVTQFASNLFGVPLEWKPDDPLRQDLVTATRVDVPLGTWGPLTADEVHGLATSDDITLRLAELAREHGGQDGDAFATLQQERSMSAARRLLATGPQPIDRVVKALGSDWTADRVKDLTEVGGRVVDSTGVPLLSARYHLWLRSTEGAFACLSRSNPHVALSRQESCSECGKPSYEFGCCSRCGTTYVVGREVTEGGMPRLMPRLAPQQSPTWVALGDSSTVSGSVDDEDEDVWDNADSEQADAILLCEACGGVNTVGVAACGGCGGSTLRGGRILRGHPRHLVGCVMCGSRVAGQVRLFDTGADAAAAVLATSLYQHLPPDSGAAGDNPGGGRKLLAFSDSRQGAAFFAPYLDNSYQRLLQRSLILRGLQESFEFDGGASRLDDVIANTVALATEAGCFPRRESRQAKERTVGLWLAQELVAFDTRQSLEGLGLMSVEFDDAESAGRLPVWSTMGLSPVEGVAVVTEMLRTLRLQGCLSMPPGVDAADEAFSPRRGPIHVRESIAEKKLLSWTPTRGANRRLDYVAKVLTAKGSGAEPRDVLSGIWRFLTLGRESLLTSTAHVKYGQVFQLDHAALLVSPRDAEVPAFRCDTCAQVYLQSVEGVCPTYRCPGRLVSWSRVVGRDAENHYVHVYRTLAPVPLKVQEHTAQWSPMEAADIQNQFIRGEVNALSCSTTFELGVDVGELQAVLLRNVPPSTANYVQRAGRAGRRTASAALVVALAQRRSHDLTQFADPLGMINGAVSAPLIPLGNERIDRRHAHSVALSSFFRHEWQMENRSWRKVGEFFCPEDGSVPIESLRKFLRRRPADVDAALRQVLPPEVQAELDIESGAWIQKLLELLELVRAEVVQEVEYFEQARAEAFEQRRDSLVGQLGRTLKTLRGRDLLGFLGGRNVLPKYGFPVDVVDLRTQTATVPVGATLDLSRDLATAVFEYAPGAEIVAGGYLWKSAGVYRLPQRELVKGWFARCTQCQYFETGLDQLDPTCPQCAGDRRAERYMVPEFGFIAERTPRKPGGAPPARSWSGGTYFVTSGEVVPPRVGWQKAPEAIKLEASRRARLMSVSTGRSDRGYLICDWCGRGFPAEGRVAKKHDHAWKSEECTGPLTRAALAHVFETDVLTIDVDLGRPASQDQMWSMLYGILDSASRLLDISRDDIDGTLWFAGATPRLVLFDTVPGGAGCVLQIPRQVSEVLEYARDKLSRCECGEETSCYACLRTYRNSSRHDQLSRGQAVGILTELVGS